MSDEGGGTPVALWCLAVHSTVGMFMHGRCDIIPGEKEKTNCGTRFHFTRSLFYKHLIFTFMAHLKLT